MFIHIQSIQTITQDQKNEIQTANKPIHYQMNENILVDQIWKKK